MLLEPFNNEFRALHISVKPNLKSHHDKRYDLDYDEYEAEAKESRRKFPNPAIPFPPIEDPTTFHQNKLWYNQSLAQHPARSGNYVIEASPKLKLDTREHHWAYWTYNDDWLMLKLLRDLSNVSCVFRQEVGRTLWMNASVHFSYDDAGDSMAIVENFLMDRPFAVAGIKELTIWIDPHLFPDGCFRTMCMTVSKHLKLDSLTIYMEMDEDDLPPEEEVQEAFGNLSALRSITVSKEFRLELELDQYRNAGPNFKDEEYEQFRINLMERWKIILRELALPDTLRVTKPETEEEKYLRSR